MRSPPPTPTLFPYTTLFRSWPGGRVLLQKPHEQPAGRQEARARAAGLFSSSPRGGGRGRPGDIRREGAALRDRKSTRLNSSHDQISYAVFCLKKKQMKTRRV